MTSIGVASLAILLLATVSSAQTIFDVTKYGAVPDGKTDNSKAFSDAWTAACAIGAKAAMVIPAGTFLVGPVIFKGPCSGNTSPTVQIQGTLKAPPGIGPVSEIGWIEFRSLNGVTVNGGGFIDGQGAQDWSLLESHQVARQLPISLRFIDDTNVMVANLTLLNSKGFHLAIQQSQYVKARHLNISAPVDSPNTDGVHICNSDHVDISGLSIATGDDCIGVGPGSTNITISHINCGPGHGISIGSLGKYPNEEDVFGVRVLNSTISHTSNGLRIKTWPASPPSHASNIVFQNIILNNVSNPILIDQIYCPSHKCAVDHASLVKVTDVTFKNITGSTSSAVAVTLQCSEIRPCQNVQFQDINLQPLAGLIPRLTATCSNVLGSALGLQNPRLCLNQ